MTVPKKTRRNIPIIPEILKFIAEGLDAKMTSVKYRFYFAALSDLDLEDIKKAANHIARTATFFPKPVDFRNAIQGNIETATIGAWEKVLQAKSKAGQYQSVKFDDPTIHSTIKLMGGWSAVCSMEGHDDEKWQRIDFEKTYKAMQGLNKDHPAYLPGLAEVDSGARGIEYEKPVVMIAAQSEKKALPPAERKALPEPEKVLSQEDVSKRVKELCDNIKVVEDAPYDNNIPCSIE